MISVHHFTTSLGMACLVAMLFACEAEPATDLGKAAIIPRPVEIIADSSNFALCPNTVIQVPEGEATQALGELLKSYIAEATGLALEVSTEEGKSCCSIVLAYAEEAPAVPESHNLTIEKNTVTILAGSGDAAGLMRGIQTFRQLIPLEPDPDKTDHWKIPTGRIVDNPHYGYRGMMLDVARHFFAVEDVKRVIDLIALYKINYLHLHLADDQGWRIEIKQYPKLTEIGGSTEVGGGEGGFYTQEDYREIVAYAQARYITIVPEIDMPGHTNAALASYPELNCDGVSPELYTGTKVGFSTLCTSKEVVYEFVDKVIGELATLTPGQYIHIGGDESHVTALEDYIPFIERVDSIVAKHGKTMVGWDEISHANLSPGSVVQYWRHAENAKRGVAKGASVLLSPAHKVYLDMQYDSTTELGLHWAAYIEADSAYLWSPETLVEGLDATAILGIESPLWTETVTTIDEIEYMVFPRLMAHAELGWSSPKQRDWENFKQRFQAHTPLLDANAINYYRSPMLSLTVGNNVDTTAVQ